VPINSGNYFSPH